MRIYYIVLDIANIDWTKSAFTIFYILNLKLQC